MIGLKQLHRGFIDRAKKPSLPGRLPVEAQPADVPVLAVDRWREASGKLTKSYRFKSFDDRDAFVVAVFSYERQAQHRAQIVIDDDCVSFQVSTKGIDRVTEADKEFASYIDVLYRDISRGVVSCHGDDSGQTTFVDER